MAESQGQNLLDARPLFPHNVFPHDAEVRDGVLDVLRDVVGALEHAIFGGPPGTYNLAGDGALTIDEIARRLGKRSVALPMMCPWAMATSGRALS